MGFRVQGLGFKGLGFRVQGLEFTRLGFSLSIVTKYCSVVLKVPSLVLFGAKSRKAIVLMTVQYILHSAIGQSTAV